MKEKPNGSSESGLPLRAVEFIRGVTRKMRYRRKVRREVQAELTAHLKMRCEIARRPRRENAELGS
jgi:hypothetical protein